MLIWTWIPVLYFRSLETKNHLSNLKVLIFSTWTYHFDTLKFAKMTNITIGFVNYFSPEDWNFSILIAYSARDSQTGMIFFIVFLSYVQVFWSWDRCMYVMLLLLASVTHAQGFCSESRVYCRRAWLLMYTKLQSHKCNWMWMCDAEAAYIQIFLPVHWNYVCNFT